MWPVDEHFIGAEWFWIPEDNIRGRVAKDRVPYDLWIREGWVTATPGNVVDDRIVKQHVINLAAIFDIREVAFDPWGARVIAQDLTEAGIQIVEFQQTMGWFSEPTKELLNLLLQGRMVNERNPVTRFCADCVSVKSDENDRIKPVKPDRRKSGKRIDGIVARIMALDRAMRNQGDGFIEPNFVVIG